MALLNDILDQLEAKLTFSIHLAVVQASHCRLSQLCMEDGMLVCVVGREREDIERSKNVRNNITTNRTCTSPKGRPRDQDWSHFEADLHSVAAFCAGGLNELAHE